MQTNLLTNWYKHSLYTCSPLQITPHVEIANIEYIYTGLSKSFGLSFFDVTVGLDMQNEKIPWLFSLFANKDHIGCLEGLYHLTQLINYLEGLDNEIQKKFRSLINSPENLRTFFFELFIFHLCDKNKIPNDKKVWENGQELEGTMTINNNVFLYECRKTFIPKRDELDIVRRLITTLYQLIPNISKYIPGGMIWSITFKRPILLKPGQYVTKFSDCVDLFIKRLNTFEGIPDIQYEHDMDEGTFSAQNYSEANHFEIQNMKQFDIIVTQKPGTQHGHFKLNITGNFGVYRTKIYKKLENAIRSKKKQHENSSFQNQIIFMDNEEFPEFNMPIFPNDNILDVKEIHRIYDKLSLKAILIILRRQYHTTGAKYSSLIFYPDHLREEAKFLETAIENMNRYF
ncbi:hypothetical protein AB6805_13825 [Chitinophaga sp. RCC_12]|uniref:hypothetical protein n=1 Tax=Chitinophaga sp. RCC_12 TaxID=3239226 RepID=UPI003524C35B